MSGAADFQAPEAEIAPEIPQPTLWRVLVRPLQTPKMTAGGIELTEKIQQDQEFVCVVGQIVAMGPSACTGKNWEDIPGYEVGDWVLYPTYGGQRIEMADGRSYVLMNDDAVICEVGDPELYRKKLV